MKRRFALKSFTTAFAVALGACSAFTQMVHCINGIQSEPGGVMSLNLTGSVAQPFTPPAPTGTYRVGIISRLMTDPSRTNRCDIRAGSVGRDESDRPTAGGADGFAASWNLRPFEWRRHGGGGVFARRPIPSGGPLGCGRRIPGGLATSRAGWEQRWCRESLRIL
jgi:hypothetical protein